MTNFSNIPPYILLKHMPAKERTALSTTAKAYKNLKAPKPPKRFIERNRTNSGEKIWQINRPRSNVFNVRGRAMGMGSPLPNNQGKNLKELTRLGGNLYNYNPQNSNWKKNFNRYKTILNLPNLPMRYFDFNYQSTPNFENWNKRVWRARDNLVNKTLNKVKKQLVINHNYIKPGNYIVFPRFNNFVIELYNRNNNNINGNFTNNRGRVTGGGIYRVKNNKTLNQIFNENAIQLARNVNLD